MEQLLEKKWYVLKKSFAMNLKREYNEQKQEVFVLQSLNYTICQYCSHNLIKKLKLAAWILKVWKMSQKQYVM